MAAKTSDLFLSSSLVPEVLLLILSFFCCVCEEGGEVWREVACNSDGGDVCPFAAIRGGKKKKTPLLKMNGT